MHSDGFTIEESRESVVLHAESTRSSVGVDQGSMFAYSTRSDTIPHWTRISRHPRVKCRVSRVGMLLRAIWLIRGGHYQGEQAPRTNLQKELPKLSLQSQEVLI